MTLDDAYQHLTDLVNSGDPQFAAAANFVGKSVQDAQAGQMSTEELAEVLLDVQRQMNIINEMSQLAYKEKLNVAINGIIAIIGIVG